MKLVEELITILEPKFAQKLQKLTLLRIKAVRLNPEPGPYLTFKLSIIFGDISSKVISKFDSKLEELLEKPKKLFAKTLDLSNILDWLEGAQNLSIENLFRFVYKYQIKIRANVDSSLKKKISKEKKSKIVEKSNESLSKVNNKQRNAEKSQNSENQRNPSTETQHQSRTERLKIILDPARFEFAPKPKIALLRITQIFGRKFRPYDQLVKHNSKNLVWRPCKVAGFSTNGLKKCLITRETDKSESDGGCAINYHLRSSGSNLKKSIF